MKKIVVIGGGISGLAAAHRLAEMSRGRSSPVEITLLEASGKLGGVIETQRSNGFLMEAGPDAFLSEKPEGVELVKRLGLEDQLIGTQPGLRKSFIVRKGRLIPVPSGFYLIAPTRMVAVFQMKALSLPGRLRLACERFVPPRVNGRADESVGQFIRRRFGREALERIGQPMIAGIYSADPDRLSLQATFPRFLELERQYGSVSKGLRAISGDVQGARGPRYSLFVTLRDGMQTLVETLVRKMPEVRIQLGARVARLSPAEGWQVVLEGAEALRADAVCVAVPAPRAAGLVRSFDPALSQALAGIPYESVATVNLAFRRSDVPHPLDGFGFVVPAVERLGLIGCTFASVKFPGRAADGTVLLRVFVGGQPVRQTEPELKAAVLRQLGPLLGVSAAPCHSGVCRYREAMPQYEVGHLERVETIERAARRHPGLYLTGNAYRGIGLPDCIREAEKSAERIFHECI